MTTFECHQTPVLSCPFLGICCFLKYVSYIVNQLLRASVYDNTSRRHETVMDIPTSRPGLSRKEVKWWGLKPQMWYDANQVLIDSPSILLGISVKCCGLFNAFLMETIHCSSSMNLCVFSVTCEAKVDYSTAVLNCLEMFGELPPRSLFQWMISSATTVILHNHVELGGTEDTNIRFYRKHHASASSSLSIELKSYLNTNTLDTILIEPCFYCIFIFVKCRSHFFRNMACCVQLCTL